MNIFECLRPVKAKFALHNSSCLFVAMSSVLAFLWDGFDLGYRLIQIGKADLWISGKHTVKREIIAS